jgi:hypothetical protein
MTPTNSLALALLLLVGLVVLLVVTVKGGDFPTKSTALVFIGALTLAAAGETAVFAATL